MSRGSASSDAGSCYDKPVPRPPKTPAKLAQLQRQNRRREYVRRHPSYLAQLDHELANPVLYGRLVKRFQTAAERQAEGKVKGYGRTLEADLVRGETRLANAHAGAGAGQQQQQPGSMLAEGEAEAGEEAGDAGLDATVHAWEGPVEDREQGLQLWRAFVEERFVHGEDEDFDYAAVDADDDLDVAARNEAEDAWFEQEDPAWAAEDLLTGEKQAISGQTGIQDF
ncbi:hypothetical protein ESCO_000077 [Escovopsis weberi]|uniref:CCD97-like C-terminal domain-containing protein n=1 Tax=Escovopsis weberi TaxID=150374 RepID=A0A0M8MUL3_ESCWE|nr:hypothetical protein ESCO_000077 [Escovopsis weberi]